MRFHVVGLFIVLSLAMLLGGCGAGPNPRLGVLLGAQESQSRPSPSMWPLADRVGLVIHSDMTGPGASPSIPQNFLETLRHRTEEFLMQRCSVSSVVPIPFPSSSEPSQVQQELLAQGQKQGVSYLVLVVLSSREAGGPVTLGEERMMTQMSGTAVENRALAEVAVLRLQDFVMINSVGGTATETLELLDAPIGENQLSRKESLDILRAQSGQQALDHALRLLEKGCTGIP